MNHQYNEELTRTAFWLDTMTLLASFERLVRNQEHLTAIDKKTMKEIHRALYESYLLAKKQKNYHIRQLERIRRNYLDERCPLVPNRQN